MIFIVISIFKLNHIYCHNSTITSSEETFCSVEYSVLQLRLRSGPGYVLWGPTLDELTDLRMA